MKPETKALLLRLLDSARANAEDDAYRCRLTNIANATAEDRARLFEYARKADAHIRAVESARKEVEGLQ